MAESAFEKLASAEAEAEKIRQTGAENQREQLKRAKADGDEKGLETLEKKLAERDGESRENIEREIKIKCSLVRTKAEERRKAALDFIFRGVTNSGN